MSRKVHLGTVSALSLALCACGGGGGEARVASTPPPPPTPTPTPTPTPPPLPAGPLGLVSSAPFATYDVHTDALGGLATGEGEIQFSYSAADNSYTIKLPGYNEGKLVPTGGDGSYNDTGWINLNGTSSNVTDGQSTDLQSVLVSLVYAPSSDLKYTSFGAWANGGPAPDGGGDFVYGIPTAAGDVPISGSATYNGQLRGRTDAGYAIFGGITLNFDFGAGTLSGEMKPDWYPVWDAESLGTYTFTNTVFSKGSTTFSGAFIPPAGVSGPSSFTGRFNGPGAAEVMGNWVVPYSIDNTNGTMAGVFGGKKRP